MTDKITELLAESRRIEENEPHLTAWNNKRAVKYADDAAEAWRSATSGEHPRMLEGLSAKHSAAADALASLPRMRRALEAVLALHRPVFRHSGQRPTGYENLTGHEKYDCGHCPPVDYPCPTVRAIESALTEEDS